MSTKRKVYQACVLSVLLYGWFPSRNISTRLIHSTTDACEPSLGSPINNSGVSTSHYCLTAPSMDLRERWGDRENASIKVMKRRVEWLGHLARMPDCRTPKACLFGWLPQACPQGGPRLRWRDVIRKDLRVMGIKEDQWYDEASTSRSGWKSRCQTEIENLIDTATN